MLAPCDCMCHATGVSSYKAVNPPIPCCLCNPFMQIKPSSNSLQLDNSQSYDGEYPTIQSLTKIVGDLSMRLNVMQSSLREFEKQRVDPVCDSIADVRLHIKRLEARLSELEEWTRKDEDKIYERIKKLEGGNIQGAHNLIHAVSKDLSERVHGLEQIYPRYDELHKEHYKDHDALKVELKSLQKYISDCDMARFESDDNLGKRIEKLEQKLESLMEKPQLFEKVLHQQQAADWQHIKAFHAGQHDGIRRCIAELPRVYGIWLHSDVSPKPDSLLDFIEQHLKKWITKQ